MIMNVSDISQTDIFKFYNINSDCTVIRIIEPLATRLAIKSYITFSNILQLLILSIQIRSKLSHV